MTNNAVLASVCAVCADDARGPNDCEERMQAMMNAALVLGFNEMAKAAETLGDKVYFRLCREQALKKLNALPNPHGYVITFAGPEASDAG